MIYTEAMSMLESGIPIVNPDLKNYAFLFKRPLIEITAEFDHNANFIPNYAYRALKELIKTYMPKDTSVTLEQPIYGLSLDYKSIDIVKRSEFADLIGSDKWDALVIETIVEDYPSYAYRDIKPIQEILREMGRIDSDVKKYLKSQLLPETDQTMLMFQMQNGPVKEKGRNGADYQSIIEFLIKVYKYFDSQAHCYENTRVIGHLEKAVDFLNQRTVRRVNLNIEGTNYEE